MQTMGNWDYTVIVKELQQYIGAYFDKFYICTEGSCLLRLRKGKAIAIVANANSLYLTEKPPETLETPPQFAMVVRKWLENSKLQSVEQLNGDRIVAFNFEAKTREKFTLVFEQFAKGNALLLNSENIIIDALKREEFASRKLKPREKYAVPPAKKNAEEITIGDFKPKGKTVAALAINANIPPFYIEEALTRTKCNSDVEQNSESEKEKLIQELKKIKEEYSPCVYLESEKPVAFSFTELQKMAKLEKKSFDSFSTALEFYYANVEKIMEKKQEKKEGGKMATRLEFQRRAIEENRVKAVENTEIANFINANYSLFEELLQITREMLREKKSEGEIEKKLVQTAEENGQKLEIKVKNGKIEVVASSGLSS